MIGTMTRRSLLALAAAATAAPGATQRGTALSLNEDPNHYFASRSTRQVTERDLVAWVDQYAGTEVRELLLCVNAQRTAFASKVWTPFWKGYDPKGPDDQPLLASLPAEQRRGTRAWIHTAWQMNQDGLDHFRIWTRRARERKLSPWLSIRMNDLHNVEDERHHLHSDFWRAHPEFRRVPYRGEMRDKALDFGRAEVRDYTFRLVDEICARYDFDGLELDWMRHGFHFAPGREAEGRDQLNRFMGRVRQRVGRQKKIGVRVPPHPHSALRLGLDAAQWAKDGNADLVVPTNFWRTTDTQMPVRLWRELLPASCQLGAGLELGLNPFPGSTTFEGRPFGYNTLETVRGAAAAFLEQGADRIYLFNYMDSQTAIEDLEEYQPLLRQCGSLDSLRGKPRRHILTYTDTWAPGEASMSPLPARVESGGWRAFRLATGPVDAALRPVVRVGIVADQAPTWKVRVNGGEAAPSGMLPPRRPWPKAPVYGFDAPVEAMRSGDTVVEVAAKTAGAVEWVEVAWLER
jgi:hypothetical protein